ncbi:hypothetical protein FQA39_LY00981 [Lamprigera yunnana]|nr:hypothetical protein FQA39_LY00981 [Lamprigera yunnana]
MEFLLVSEKDKLLYWLEQVDVKKSTELRATISVDSLESNYLRTGKFYDEEKCSIGDFRTHQRIDNILILIHDEWKGLQKGLTKTIGNEIVDHHFGVAHSDALGQKKN